MKKLKSNLLGILILVIGVIVGVLLVRQTQNFKNKALEKASILYTICHKTGDPDSPWQEVKVSTEELSDYLNKGDIYGECPEELINP